MTFKTHLNRYCVIGNVDHFADAIQVLVIGEYSEKDDLDDLDDFLEMLPDYVTNIILLSTFPIFNADISNYDKNLLIIENREKVNLLKFIVDIYPYLDVEWIFLLNSNEYLDRRFIYPDIMDGKLASARSGIVHVVYSRDRVSYYVDAGSHFGVYPQVRMINLKKYTFEELHNINNIELTGSIVTRQLLISRISEHGQQNINLFSPSFSLNEIFNVGEHFENVSQMKDSELPKLLTSKLDIISDYFLNEWTTSYRIGLYDGDLGVVLALALYYLNTQEEKYFTKMNQILDSVQDILESGVIVHNSFCSGLAGYGWLISYLKSKNIIDVDDELFSQMDAVLKFHMELYCKDKKFDQLHEAIGIGLYFLKRKKTSEIEYLITQLYINKVDSDGEYKWPSKSYSKLLPFDKYDFGLAHGMAGILYFFTQCYISDIKRDISLEIIKNITTFYYHNIQDFNECRSFFPGAVYVDDYIASNRNLPARAAWCYGDPGVLYSLFMAAKYTNNTIMLNDTIDMLKKVAERRDCLETVVRDAGFCHGSASLSHIFNRLYYHTGDKIFKETSMYWLKQCLIMGRNRNYPAGYVFAKGEDEWSENYTLLEGLAGVASVFMSALDYRHIDWDEVFMLNAQI